MNHCSPGSGIGTEPKMSGDVRISGQFGVVAATHTQQLPQLGNSLGFALHNNRTMIQEPSGHLVSSPTGCSGTGLDPAFVITHSGRVGSAFQQNAAAAFFFAKEQKKVGGGTVKCNLPDGKIRHKSEREDLEDIWTNGRDLLSNFSTILSKCPPPPPSMLLKKCMRIKTSAEWVK